MKSVEPAHALKPFGYTRPRKAAFSNIEAS
jgi:hypothetical protein